MNIFVLDEDPVVAAQMHCDKHIPKMCVEAAQMMASALRRHGATDEQMPLTKSGTPYKGGYAYHPCTVWAGDSRANFQWLADHALGLLNEYFARFNNIHACHGPILLMKSMHTKIPDGELTTFAQAMPDEYRDDDAVKSYRAYYHSKQFAKWEKGTPAPSWWRGVEVTA
ncbi:MAG: pyrimidine dimer DNA glycosylase/endonuclease V [Candidatus Poseidoniales archaeon]